MLMFYLFLQEFYYWKIPSCLRFTDFLRCFPVFLTIENLIFLWYSEEKNLFLPNALYIVINRKVSKQFSYILHTALYLYFHILVLHVSFVSCFYRTFDYSENADYDHTILNVTLEVTYFVLGIDKKAVIKNFSLKNFTAIVCELLSLMV